MSSSYSARLRLELPATGEKVGAWGVVVNTNLGTLIEDAISGTAAITLADANYTLSTNQGVADEARCAIIALSGTLTASRNIICPSLSKLYLVVNSTTGGFPIVFKTAAGTGVTVPNGQRMHLHCDGTNVQSISVNLTAQNNTWSGTNAWSGTSSWTASATFGADIVLSRTATPTTGVVYFGNTGAKFLNFDGTQLNSSMPIALGSNAISSANGTFTALSSSNAAITGGSVTGLTSFSASSDRTLKQDIETYAPGTTQLLRPVSFLWRSNLKTSLGFIAQELEEVVPELVHTSDTGLLSVDYLQIIAILTADLQDALKRIENLERRSDAA